MIGFNNPRNYSTMASHIIKQVRSRTENQNKIF